MSCPHSLKPGPCSSCMGAKAKRVVQLGDQVYIDGELVTGERENPWQLYPRRGK